MPCNGPAPAAVPGGHLRVPSTLGQRGTTARRPALGTPAGALQDSAACVEAGTKAALRLARRKL